MNSKTNPEELVPMVLFGYPAPARFSLPCWPSPVEPGGYGEAWQNTVLLTTDHRPTVAQLGQACTGQAIMVVAVPAGGFPTQLAGALKMVATDWIVKALLALAEQEGISAGVLWAPESLARAFNWGNGTQLGPWSIQVGPDEPISLVKLSQQSSDGSKFYSTQSLPVHLHRLIGGLMLWAGQCIIFAIPLLIFGWGALFLGCGALLSGALGFTVLGQFRQLSGWRGALFVSALIALFVGFLTYALFQPDFLTLARYAGGFGLASLWMGFIFRGAKSS